MPLDHAVALLLAPLAIWILLSGMDDLFISLVLLCMRKKRFQWPREADLDRTPERRIAILVPLWKEHGVIGEMLERNLSVIRYRNYDVFVGVYPNDELTIRAAAAPAKHHSNVHLAMGPHNGPTSKGDCLNWVYRWMKTYETRQGVRFEIVITHDAEDLIHPDSLRLINWFSGAYEMVQVPVLPLPTPFREFTHGLYCDEFAEYQTKDIPVRQHLRGFIPSNGVGTGFSREALELLAATRHGKVFDPECLTEDYENGLRLHQLGCPQIFVPLRFQSAGPMATREYFPRKARAAVRQRSRWVAGITLQGWQRHGWCGPWRLIYWFWRDRKGLVGNLLAPAANASFLLALASRLPLVRDHVVWRPNLMPAWAAWCCLTALAISVVQAAVRTWCAASIYGWCFAAGVPLRMLWGNVVNCLATIAALRQFILARLRHRTLAWRKTEHDYPQPVSAERGRPRLGEVLVRMRCVSMDDLEEMLLTCPPGMRLGEYMVRGRKLSEQRLYEALSSQSGIPLGMPDAGEVDRLTTRVLPAATARRWRVLPYRVAVGRLHVVTPNVPTEDMTRDLSAVSDLELRFRLVRPEEFDALAREYLPHDAVEDGVPA